MKIGSYVVQNVTFSNVGFGAPQYNVGESDVLLWEFRLATTGDRNNVFKSVTLRNAGTTDLLNSVEGLAIYNDGKKVSTDVAISGREVTFTVNSEIENGKTENYQIRGNIVSSDRNSDTVIFELRNSTDLVVVEQATSFSAPILWVAATVVMGTSTIIGGDLLLTRDTSVGLNQTVSASTNDVVLLSAKFNPKESVTLEDVRINYNSSAGLFNQFTSLRLLIDGRTVSTYTPAATDVGNGTFTFDTTFTSSQATTIQVVWNVKNNATLNSTFNIPTFAAADLWVASKRYVSNDETAVINGSSQGTALTIANSTLTLTRNDAIDSSNSTVVSGATDVTLLGFSARANDVSDVRITAINPIATYVTAPAFTVANVNNVRLYQGDTVIATRNNFDFSGLSVTIPKNSAVNFKIVADFTNTLTAANSITLNLAPNAVVARNVSSNETVTAPAVSGQTIAFVAGGNALVTLNSSTAQSSIVTPSTSETSVLKFDIEAKNDKLRLTDLYVKRSTAGIDAAQTALNTANTQATADRTDASNAAALAADNAAAAKTAAQTAYGTDVAFVAFVDAIDTVVAPTNTRAWVVSAIQGFAIANFTTVIAAQTTLTNAQNASVDLTAALRTASINVDGRKVEGTVLNADTLYFSIGNSNPIVIDKDQIKTVDLMISLNDSSARSAQSFQFRVAQTADLAGGVAVNGTSNGMRLVSESNGDELANTTTAAVSNAHLLARSKPTVAQSAFTSSTTRLYEFTVTADANRKITLTDLAIATAGSFTRWVGDISVYKDNENGANLAFTISSTNVVTPGTLVNREIAAGQTNKYIVVIAGASGTASQTREAKVTELSYVDDVDTPVTIATSTRNVGVPTVTSTFTY